YASFRIAPILTMALGTNDETSTYSGNLALSALRSEQWSLSPQGPKPSMVGTASQIKLPSLKPPRCSELMGTLISSPAFFQSENNWSVPALRGQGRHSVKISTLT